MRRAVVLGTLFLAGACGSGRPPERGTEGELFGEGTRLRAIWEQAPGAPKVLRGWYDPVLGTGCTFQSSPATTGPTYCRPLSHRGGTVSTFADSACTVPIVSGGSRWFLELPPDPCSSSFGTLYELGEVADPTTVYWVAAGACQPIPTISPPVEYRYIARTLDADALVSASRAPHTGGARVVPIVLEASDGSWAHVGAYDTWLETDLVLPQHWPDGFGYQADTGAPSRWSPDARPTFDFAAPSLFSEPTCSTPAAEAIGCNGSPFLLGTSSPQACGDTGARYFRTGPELAPSSVYRSGAPESCESLTGAPTAFRYFAVGPPLSDQDLAPVATIGERGEGRLALRLVGTEGGPAVTTGGYTDTRDGTICRTGRAVDGVNRCLPPTHLGVRYRDPACTELVVGLMECEARPPRVSYSASGDPGLRVFPVLDASAETVFDLATDGTCVPGAILPGRAYYQLGPELPPTDFVEVVRSAL